MFFIDAFPIMAAALVMRRGQVAAFVRDEGARAAAGGLMAVASGIFATYFTFALMGYLHITQKALAAVADLDGCCFARCVEIADEQLGEASVEYQAGAVIEVESNFVIYGWCPTYECAALAAVLSADNDKFSVNVNLIL